MLCANPKICDLASECRSWARAMRTNLLVCGALLVFAAWAMPVLAGSHENWVPTWSTAPHASDTTFTDQTIRMVVRSTVGGNQVRIQLSNRYGTKPLSIGSAHVALIQSGSAIAAGTDRILSFGGQVSIQIPPGAYALSDPVGLDVPQLSDLAVSVFLPDATPEATMHENGLKTTYISPSGDFTAAAEMPAGSTKLSYYWLTAVYVATKRPTQVVVAFGDSITDGADATPNTDSSWPGVLGKLMITETKHHDVAVLNEGIGGNRLLHDFFADNALARFDRDAIDQPRVSAVILLEGINDIGYPYAGNDHRDQLVTAANLIQAMQQLITRCHLHNIKIIGATLTPYLGAAYASPDGETTREAVNQWIRTGGAFDAVADFDKATEDPAHPGHFLPAYDSGDHLHPGDAGYKVMAEAASKALKQLAK